MHKYLIVLMLPLLLLTACKKEFRIPLPQEDYKPVLNAFLSEDSTVYARVTLSGRPETFGTLLYTEPDNATVQLYEDGVYIETLQTTTVFDKRYYIGQHRLRRGRQYRLTLSLPGYAAVEGTDIVPDRNTFSLSNKDSYTGTSGDGYPESNLSFTLKHDGSGQGYYQFRVYTYYTTVSTIAGTDTTWRQEKVQAYFNLKNSDGGLFGNSDNYISYTGNVLNDKVLDPGESTLITLNSAGGSYDNVDSFEVEVWQLSDASYKYLHSVQTALNSDGDPTAEKVVIYNNIQNGFGIVGGMTIKTASFPKPR